MLLLSALIFSATAQEVLTGLRQNTQLIKQSHSYEPKSEKEPVKAIYLPFLDDFSYNTLYPDPNLWMSKQGFVNNTYPIYPPTIGVVTLDALDENGKIYANASKGTFPADTLKSRPIRLDSTSSKTPITIQDSIYFSFYYQPGGGTDSFPYKEWARIGDAPEYSDKLVLDFGYATGNVIFMGMATTPDTLKEGEYYNVGDSIPNPFFPGTYYIFSETVYPGYVIYFPSDSLFGEEEVWNEVWSANGTTLDEWLDADENRLSFFKQVMIPITDEQYLRDNFQFRFRNYASLEDNGIVGWASNVDQWHIDYVYLNINRRRVDTLPDDVAFVAPTTSFLKKYQSMPWSHFNPTRDMIESYHNQLSNLSDGIRNTSYTFNVVKNNTEDIYTYPKNSINAEPYYFGGLHSYAAHSNPEIEFSGQLNPNDGRDSALFTVIHVFQIEGGVSDICHKNDTMRYQQKFYNYFAYDDGTPEAGYSILSTMTKPKASFAVRFTLSHPDTLRCIRMFFNSVLNDANFDYFTLKVWEEGSDKLPGRELYSQPSQTPMHTDDYLDFVNYYLEEPIPVSGSFFVGFYQDHATQLNIGFDQNTDARGEFYYNTKNEWMESFLKGSPMIRPVLGKYFPQNVSVPQNKEQTITLSVFPNPTNGIVHFAVSNPDILIEQIVVYDIYGKAIRSISLNSHDGNVDISSLNGGIYLFRFISGNKVIATSKVVKY